MRKSELAQGSRHAIDMQVAATAVVHHLVLVARDIRHFASVGLDLLDPWSSPPILQQGSEHAT